MTAAPPAAADLVAGTGRPDVEVVVQRGDRERGSQAWADHATVLAKPVEQDALTR